MLHCRFEGRKTVRIEEIHDFFVDERRSYS